MNSSFKKVSLTKLFILFAWPCFAQVELSVSAGFYKSNTTFSQTIYQGPKGNLIPNQGESTLAASLQASIPIKERLRLQGGVRFIDKYILYRHNFEYPNQFSFRTTFINSGAALEMPLNLVYELPISFLNRSLRLHAGGTLAVNDGNKLSFNYGLDIFTPAPSTLSYSFNHEVVKRKSFFTPGLEVGFEITPLAFRNFDFKVLYHHDLIPAFGGVHYKYKFQFTNSLPIVLDEPEGLLTPMRTSYFLFQLSYRLPFFNKKDSDSPEPEIH